MPETGTGLYDRTVERLGRALRGAAGSARVRLTGRLRPDLPEPDAARLRRQIDTCLVARGGEVSARARAAELGQTYLSLSPTGRARFLALLAHTYGVDRNRLDDAIGRLGNARVESDRQAAEAAVRKAAIPRRVRLLTQFNAVPQGVKFVVDLRAELRATMGDDPALQALDRDLKDVLAGWFDVGFLDLARITWHASASLLEKLIAYEAVHKIRSWTDLKNRLDSDRRCYAFFHPRMPEEPLIFVEVALTAGLAADVQALLDESAPAQDPASADTAIFYSISNCQRGLAGVSFGAFLIKRVVDALRADLPNLKTFATLSPIPGFRRWLEERVAAGQDDLLGAKEERMLAALAGPGATGPSGLLTLLARPDWPHDPALVAAIREPVMRLGARYLVREKANGRAYDRVAHFHLLNGASIERLNWLGNRSPEGMHQAAGLAVNYNYRLDEIEANHEAYTGDGRVVAGPALSRLL